MEKQNKESDRVRVIALGDFRAPLPPLDRRLSALDVVAVRALNIDQLPPLGCQDILLTELKWLTQLNAEAQAHLHQRLYGVGAWVALTDENRAILEKIAWKRAGVSQFMALPIEPNQIAQLVEELHDRVAGRKLSVCLVDDDRASLTYHAALLEQAGLHVHMVDDPFSVQRIIEDHHPDALILDVEMPGCTGPELVSILRERADGIHLPIIYLTSHQDAETQILTQTTSPADYFVKPVNSKLLIAVVRENAYRYRSLLRTEQLNRKIENRARQVVEDMRYAFDQHAIISISDRHGNIIDVNDRFCAISGYTRDELIGKNHRMVKSGDHDSEFYHRLWQTISSGAVWHGEICNRRKDGERYWVEATIVPLLDGNGIPNRYISVRTDITVLKLQQLELASAEERLRQGQHFANIGSWEWDLIKDRFICTDQVMTMLGYQGQKPFLKYEDLISLLHPEDQERVRTSRELSLKTGVAYDCEYRIIQPDGSYLWVNSKGAVVRDSNGVPMRFLGVMQNIHERKLAQLALAESERRFSDINRMLQLVLDNIPVRVFWKDTNLHFLGCNKSFAKDAGRECPESLIGEDDFAMPWAAEAPLYRADDQIVLQSRQPKLDYEELQTTPDGRQIWLNTSKLPLVDSQETLVGILGVYTDVTERVLTQQKLQESEQRFSFAVDGAGDGIWDWNMVTGHMLLSGNYEGMLGYDKGELEATVAAWQESVHPEDLPDVKNALASYLSGATSVYEPELRLRCKDGQYKWVLCRGTIVGRNESGEPIRMIGIHTDISVRKSSEFELKTARENAERANQAKSDFLSSMSHELRTPLNAILGFGQILEYEDSLDAECQDSVHEILKAGRHLLELINEVLDLAKVESGRLQLSIEPTELGVVLNDCRQLIQPLAMARQISMSWPDSGTQSVRVDRTRFKQVLLNLLSNAVKYNREGGKVNISLSNSGEDRLRIAVSDTGHGIATDRLNELFQPFSRLDAEHSDIEGTGIGLSITRRLTEIMGGEIGVESNVGEGTTFWVEFVRAYPATIDEGSGIDDRKTLRSELAKSTYTLLCIDDNPTNLKLMNQLLGRLPHIHLITAHAAELGIELALAHRPDLILLDINMPGMDGFQVLDVIRSNHPIRNIPIFAVTANAMPRDIAKGKAAGFNEYITKPIEAEQFIHAINAYLENGSTE